MLTGTARPPMLTTITEEHRADLVRYAQSRLAHGRAGGHDAEDVVQEVLLRVLNRHGVNWPGTDSPGTDSTDSTDRPGTDTTDRPSTDRPSTDQPGTTATPRGAVVSQPAAYLRRAVANECVTRWRRHRREVPTDSPPDRLQRDHADPCTTRLAVRDALSALTHRQREILVRGFFLDHDDKQIAAGLGISPVTVRSVRRRGLGHLRRLLESPDHAAQTSPAGYRRPSGAELRIIA
jgi:DNA-directed RNA polymerase specialized sigma24 family protein